LKMLRFCGSLELKEVRNGLRRHALRGGYVVPPPPILAHVLAAYGFEMQDGHVSQQQENPSNASTSEEIILEELEYRGPIVSHYELAQAFAQAGLSVAALSAALRYSPLFTRVDVGLWKLRGKSVTHGDIRNARQRQPVTAADPEILFDPTGAVRLRLNLGNVAITSGVIFIAHIPNLTGTWGAQANGLPCGNVRVRDNQIWSLSKSFRVINAKVGERVELRFDMWEHTIKVAKVGDETQ